MRLPISARLVAASLGAVLALAGCASGPSDTTADGRTQIVASTGVWGDIAATVGGDAVHVSTIISEPGMDPHEYQTTPADVLAVAKADLVVYNGGHYDQFMESILDSSGVSAGDSINAYALPVTDRGLGGTRAQADENEHVWFDLSTVDAVAATIAERLGALDPANAATFTANAEALHAELLGLADEAAAIKAAGPRPVITTEPVTHYLLAQAGIEDLTPTEFGEAIEQGTDPAPAVIAELRARLDSGAASALVYNIQTESPTTESLRTAAEKAGLPVVLVSESLPEGEHYVAWVRQVLDSLRQAVAS